MKCFIFSLGLLFGLASGAGAGVLTPDRVRVYDDGVLVDNATLSFQIVDGQFGPGLGFSGNTTNFLNLNGAAFTSLINPVNGDTGIDVGFHATGRDKNPHILKVVISDNGFIDVFGPGPIILRTGASAPYGAAGADPGNVLFSETAFTDKNYADVEFPGNGPYSLTCEASLILTGHDFDTLASNGAFTLNTSVLPEPSTWALAGVGIGGFLTWWRCCVRSPKTVNK
jgi:hypothetical protein